MTVLDLSIDELLTTTRAVRQRLDLTRPVEVEVIQKCLELALQAPSAGAQQNWHFIVVTDANQRQALAELYRKGMNSLMKRPPALTFDKEDMPMLTRIATSARYLFDHLHEVPVLIIPCVRGRTENLPVSEQQIIWASILPAMWSFMLAARSHGLGTSLTSYHLFFEQQAADLLSIPYQQVMQTGLIPVAYTVGTEFKPATRKPLESVLHWNRW